MAGCDNVENALCLREAGADFVGATMRGYTPGQQASTMWTSASSPSSRACPAKVIAEIHPHAGRAVQALYAGAFALVVGGAITRPAEITARYTAAINNHK